MDDKTKLERLLEGYDVDFKPPTTISKMVTFYLCTTGEDMLEERKCIMKTILPQMKTFCSKLGLDIDIYDTSLDQVSNSIKMDLNNIEVCQQTLQNVLRKNEAPNLMFLLGDKHGDISIPIKIPQQEYETFHNILQEENEDVKLLDSCFRMDMNSIPPQYILMPISDVINETEPKKCFKQWIIYKKQLQSLFVLASNVARHRKLLTEETANKYLISDIEREVRTGLVSSINKSSHQCTCIIRSLETTSNLILHDEKNIEIYMDIGKDGVQCLERKEHLNGLYNEIKNSVSSTNLHEFKVPWLQGGISNSHQQHKTYLKHFTLTIKKTLQDLLLQFSDQMQQKDSRGLIIENEVIYHSSLCFKMKESFYGREEMLETFKSQLKEHWKYKSEVPLLIHGISGCGKTFLSAKLICEIRQWTDMPNLVIVYRFLGRTDESNDLYKLIESLCQQICQIHNLKKYWSSAYLSLNQIIMFFHALIIEMESLDRPPLLIVLDGLNHLHTTSKHKALVDWLPMNLNGNCKIIVTTEANVKNIKRNFQNKYNLSNGIGESMVKDQINEFCFKPKKTSMLSFQRKSTKVSPRGSSTTNTPLTKQEEKQSIKATPKSSTSSISVRNNSVSTKVPEITINIDEIDSTIELNDDLIRRERTEEMLLVGRESTNTFNQININENTNTSSVNCHTASNLFKLDESLSHHDRNVIFNEMMVKMKRTLTQDQADFIKSCLEQCPQVLYLSLVSRVASKWHSFDALSTIPLSPSELFGQMLQDVEQKCGSVLVAHALGYITLSKYGLNESQLLDVLSLDHVVLSEAFDQVCPLQDQVIRLPVLLWKRVWFYLGDVLEESYHHDYNVLKWCHSSFEEVVKFRYLRNEEKTKYLCKTLTDYFLGTSCYDIKSKHITLYKQNRKKIRYTYKQLTPQPTQYTVNMYNIRKLIELPKLIARTSNEQFLFDNVLFNFEWLRTKIEALGVNEVINDYEMFLHSSYSFEVHLVKQTFELETLQIEKHMESLGNILLKVLYQTNFKKCPNLKKLFVEIKEYLNSQNQPLLFLQKQNIVENKAVTRYKVIVQQPGEIKFVKCLQLKQGDKEEVRIVCLSKKNNTLYVTFYDSKDMSLISCITLSTEITDVLVFASTTSSFLAIALDELHLIRTSSMTVSCVLENNRSPTTCIQDNKDGTFVAIGYSNGMIRVLETEHFGIVSEFSTECDRLTNMFFMNFPLKLVVFPYIKSDLAIIDFKMSDSIETTSLNDEDNIHADTPVCCMDTHRTLLYGSNGLIRCHDITMATPVFTFPGHNTRVVNLKVLSNDLFASSCQHGCLKIWHFTKRILLHSLRGHQASIMFLNHCKASNILLSTSKDDITNVWDLHKFVLRQTLIVGDVNCIDSVDEMIVTGCDDKQLRLWEGNKQVAEEVNKSTALRACQKFELSPSQTHAIITEDSKRIVLWDMKNDVQLWKFEGDATCTCFATDSFCFIGTENGELHMCTIEQKNRRVTALKIFEQSITSMKYLCDDILLITALDGNVITYNFTSRCKLQTFQPHSKTIRCILWKPSFIAFGSEDCNITFFRRAHNKINLLQTFEGSDTAIVCLAFLDKLNHVISGNQSGCIQIWDVKSGEILQNLCFSVDGVNCILGNDFSTKLLIGGKSKRRQLFEIDYIRPDDVTYFNGHKSGISCLKMTDCMNFIVTSSYDRSLKVWDDGSKKIVDSITLPSQIVNIVISSLKENCFYIIYVLTRSRLPFIVHLHTTSRKQSQNPPTSGEGHLIMLNNSQFHSTSVDTVCKDNNVTKKCCAIV